MQSLSLHVCACPPPCCIIPSGPFHCHIRCTITAFRRIPPSLRRPAFFCAKLYTQTLEESDTACRTRISFHIRKEASCSGLTASSEHQPSEAILSPSDIASTRMTTASKHHQQTGTRRADTHTHTHTAQSGRESSDGRSVEFC